MTTVVESTATNLTEVWVRPLVLDDARGLIEGDRVFAPYAGNLVSGYTVSKIVRTSHDGGHDQQPHEHISVSLQGDTNSTWGFHWSEYRDGSFKERWIPDLFVVCEQEDQGARLVKIAGPAYTVVTVRARVPMLDKEEAIAFVEQALTESGIEVSAGSSAQHATGLRVNVYKREYDYSATPIREFTRLVATAVRSEEAFAYCEGGMNGQYLFENAPGDLVVGS